MDGTLATFVCAMILVAVVGLATSIILAQPLWLALSVAAIILILAGALR